jgi:hypothetical protein
MTYFILGILWTTTMFIVSAVILSVLPWPMLFLGAMTGAMGVFMVENIEDFE